MKRFVALLLMAVFVVSLTVCSQAAPEVDASNDPVVYLTFGGTSAAEDNISQAMERIAALCDERSGGTIKISTYPASQLGDAVSQMESIISGTQDIFVEATFAYMYSYGVEEAGVEPFGLWKNQDLLKKAVESDLFTEWCQKMKDLNGVETLAANYYRPQSIIASKTEINGFDELNGLKLRTVPSDTTMAAYSAMGAAVTPVAYAEVYLSLQQGVIDATMCSFDAAYTMKFYEVAPFIFTACPNVPGFCIWMNAAKLASMTEAQQQILKETCIEVGDWFTEKNNNQLAEYIEAMEAAGVKITDPSDEWYAEMDNRWREVALKYEEDGSIPAGTYDKVKAMLDEE